MQSGEYVIFSYCALRELNIDLFHRGPRIMRGGPSKFLPYNFDERSPFPYPGEGTLLIGAAYLNDFGFCSRRLFDDNGSYFGARRRGRTPLYSCTSRIASYHIIIFLSV